MVLAATLLLAAACSDEAAQGPPVSDGAVADPGKALFDPTKIVKVEITMPAADWEIIRKDKRDLSSFYGENCRQKPVYSTYVWKKTTTVKVNGHQDQRPLGGGGGGAGGRQRGHL